MYVEYYVSNPDYDLAKATLCYNEYLLANKKIEDIKNTLIDYESVVTLKESDPPVKVLKDPLNDFKINGFKTTPSESSDYNSSPSHRPDYSYRP